MRGFFVLKQQRVRIDQSNTGRIVTYWQTYLTATIFSRIGRIVTYFFENSNTPYFLTKICRI